MTISEWMKSATEALAESGCPDPAVDARWIAEDVLRMSAAELRFEGRVYHPDGKSGAPRFDFRQWMLKNGMPFG